MKIIFLAQSLARVQLRTLPFYSLKGLPFVLIVALGFNGNYRFGGLRPL
ncbi:hypothetical protein [Streptococcus dysgalactiae]|nr:hypothetical protein [Streptococcus dysgalactiae]